MNKPTSTWQSPEMAKRLQRRLSSVASQVGALQKLEDKLLHGDGPPSTISVAGTSTSVLLKSARSFSQSAFANCRKRVRSVFKS